MIQKFKFNKNNITFQMENGEVMVNATEMAKPFGKLAKDFLKLDQTEAFIKALSRKDNLPIASIQRVIRGGAEQGTWMHQKLALKFAAWLSPEFELWCWDKVEELITTGKVEIKAETPEEYLLRHANTTEQKRNSINVNATNYIKGGATQIIDYNQKSMLLHTGKYPNQWKKIAEAHGLKTKQRASGKEAVRNLHPELAIAMSITDEFVFQKGKRLEEVAPISLQSVPLFKMLIDNGMIKTQKKFDNK